MLPDKAMRILVVLGFGILTAATSVAGEPVALRVVHSDRAGALIELTNTGDKPVYCAGYPRDRSGNSDFPPTSAASEDRPESISYEVETWNGPGWNKNRVFACGNGAGWIKVKPNETIRFKVYPLGPQEGETPGSALRARVSILYQMSPDDGERSRTCYSAAFYVFLYDGRR